MYGIAKTDETLSDDPTRTWQPTNFDQKGFSRAFINKYIGGKFHLLKKIFAHISVCLGKLTSTKIKISENIQSMELPVCNATLTSNNVCVTHIVNRKFRANCNCSFF